jgi:hypothetical protein
MRVDGAPEANGTYDKRLVWGEGTSLGAPSLGACASLGERAATLLLDGLAADEKTTVLARWSFRPVPEVMGTRFWKLRG